MERNMQGPGHDTESLMANKPEEIDLRSTAPAVNSHSEAVQALRKYLLRKMSSEDSSGEKELESNERVISVAESNGSKLYCSLVRRTDEPDRNQGKLKYLAKHKSLDLYDSPHHPQDEYGRYLRTDLCIPVLHSKCSFCEDFFENEEQLRKHLRDSHFQYFLNYIQLRPLTSTKSLSDLPFSSALQLSSDDSSVNRFDGSDQGGKPQKKQVKCEVCGKCFSTKWNCKQHLKCHAKESSQMMDTSSTSGGELSPPLPSSSNSSSGSSY